MYCIFLKKISDILSLQSYLNQCGLRYEKRTSHKAILTSLIDLTFIKIQRSNNTEFCMDNEVSLKKNNKLKISFARLRNDDKSVLEGGGSRRKTHMY